MPARNHPRVIPKAARRSPLVLAIAGLLAAAGGLHLAALPSHLESSALVGAFFAATALGQLLAAVLIATRPSPRTTAAIIAGNLAVLAIWAVSRTTGLPVGGEVGTPEPFGVLDGLAAAAQILVVAGGLRTIIRGRGSRPRPFRRLAAGPRTRGGVARSRGFGTGLVDAGHHHHHADRTEDVWRAFLLEPAESTNDLPAADGHSDGDHRHAGRCAASDPCGAGHHHSG